MPEERDWIAEAIAEFPNLELPFIGAVPDPADVPEVQRLRAIPPRAEAAPFNSTEERKILHEWMAAQEALYRVAVVTSPENGLAGLTNALMIEDARFQRWVRLRGIEARAKAERKRA